MRRLLTRFSSACTAAYAVSSPHLQPEIRADSHSNTSAPTSSITRASAISANNMYSTQSFEARIKQTASNPNSAINLTQNLLQQAQMTSLTDIKHWILHSNGNGPNLNSMYEFWKDLKFDLLSNRNIEHGMFRFTIFNSRNEYFQFIIEKKVDQWIVYKPEQEWTDAQVTFERPSTISTADQDWSADLYNAIKKKYGRLQPLDRDHIVEFLGALQKVIAKTVQKEALWRNLVKSNVFDEQVVAQSLQPALKSITWSAIKEADFEKVEMIPLAVAEKGVVAQNWPLYEDEGLYQNFVYAYMECECSFGFAHIFGHLMDSDVQMLKVEYFEPDTKQ